MPSSNVRFKLRVVAPKGYDINPKSSWFDTSEGQTTEYGWADMTQNWKFVPGASLNMDSYQVESRAGRSRTGCSIEIEYSITP